MSAYRKEIKREQVRLLYRQSPFVLGGSSAACLVLMWILWDHVSHATLLFWSGLFFSLTALRTLMIRRYHKIPPEQIDADHWARRFCANTAASGVLWGAGSVLFYLPQQPHMVLFVACMYAGLMSGASAALSAYLPAYYLFIFAASAPMAAINLLQGDTIYLSIGTTVFLYLAVCVTFARTNNRTIVRLIESQQKNIELLDVLREQKEEAERNRQVAETAVLAKSRFLAAASHDLRQPLHALGLFVDSLRHRYGEGEAAPLIDNIHTSADALNRLLSELLDVSKLDAGAVEVSPQHVSLQRLIADLRAEFEFQAADKGLQLETQVGDQVACADPVLLTRILRNLVSNAVRYTEQGYVRIVCTTVADGLAISVEDSGIGIPINEKDKVFSEYYQVGNPERDRTKGLGLGLAIVHRLCELMSLPLELRSETGSGTLVTVIVPRGDSLRVPRQREEKSGFDLTELTVCVVDDERDILEGMGKVLMDWGCRTILAESSDQAIADIARTDAVPTVIVADYRLRDNETGAGAVAAIREELNQDIPAVLITGDTSAARIREAKASGFRLLHKPVAAVELRTALHQEVLGQELYPPGPERAAAVVATV